VNLDELAARLQDRDPRVRRIAAMDLAKAGEPGLAMVAARLSAEDDEKTALTLVRLLGEGRWGGARLALAQVRDAPATPVMVYHAAVLAHDRLERREGP
jgi:hypothetical protein